jgi:hypothetical protein
MYSEKMVYKNGYEAISTIANDMLQTIKENEQAIIEIKQIISTPDLADSFKIKVIRRLLNV